jgi:hypothetical protein
MAKQSLRSKRDYEFFGTDELRKKDTKIFTDIILNPKTQAYIESYLNSLSKK